MVFMLCTFIASTEAFPVAAGVIVFEKAEELKHGWLVLIVYQYMDV